MRFSFRPCALLIGCFLVMLLPVLLPVLGARESHLHQRFTGSGPSPHHADYDRVAQHAKEHGSGLPGWIMIAGMVMLAGGVAVCGCMAAIVGWLYAEYKLARGYISMVQFAWEVVQKLLRGENPLPRGANGKMHTPDELVRQLPGMNNKLGRYIAKYGMQKAEELFDKYVETDAQGHYRRRVGSTSSTDSE